MTMQAKAAEYHDQAAEYHDQADFTICFFVGPSNIIILCACVPSPLNYSRKLSHLGKQLGSAVFSLIWKTAGNTLNKEDIWEFRYEKQLERTFWFLRENNKHLHDSDRSSRNLRECFGLVCESERVWWERDNWCRCSGILNLLTHLCAYFVFCTDGQQCLQCLQQEPELEILKGCDESEISHWCKLRCEPCKIRFESY